MKMTIKRFTILIIISYFVAVVSGSIYQYLRYKEIELKNLSAATKGAVLRMEYLISMELGQHGLNERELQIYFDRALATSPFLESVSFSTDAKKIDVSTDRRAIDEPFPSNVSELMGYDFRNGKIDGKYFFYKLSYFKGTELKNGYLLIKIGYDDISKKLLSSTYDIIVKTLYAHFIFYAIIFLISVKYFIRPLREITEFAANGNSIRSDYVIFEFENLKTTLNSSFESLREQNRSLRAALEKEIKLENIIKTVTDINQLLISAKDMPLFLQKCCDRLCKHGDYEMVWIEMIENGKLGIKYKSGISSDSIDSALLKFENEMPQKSPFADTIKKGKINIVANFKEHPLYGYIKEELDDDNIKGLISIPLRKDIYSEPFGVLSVYSSSKTGFDEKEVAMLDELAGDIGFGINSFMQQKELENQMYVHRLSRIGNRFKLFKDLQGLSSICVGVLNIDRFKDINEIYGVHVGDKLLVMFAAKIGEIAQKDGFTFYHINADEFALVEANGDCRLIKAEIEKLIELVDDFTFDIDGIDIDISVSAGISTSKDKALEEAETALKKAKAKKQKYICFEDIRGAIEEQKNDNIIWYKKLKKALKDDRIRTFYQPLVSTKTGEIVKYECLVRLEDERGEMHSPFFFLDIAKKTRLYPELTKAVLRNAVDKFGGKNIDFSINLSIEDMVSEEMSEYIKQTVGGQEICKNIIFEILESEGIESYSEVLAFTEEMKRLGCRFAVDDFGTGYSNFEYLMRLNVNYLKIDGSLIKNITSDANAKSVVRGIYNFANSIGIETVAEFVSSKEIYEEVKSIGIEYCQGYYFGTPSSDIINP